MSITASTCQTLSRSLDGINRQVSPDVPPPSLARGYIYIHVGVGARARYIQAIIIYLFGHLLLFLRLLLLIPTSICFRAKALLGVINLVSVSPYRAARSPAFQRRVRCVLDGPTGLLS